jgi:hypothetical protein
MKKGDLVKPNSRGLWLLGGYGIGLILASDQLGSVKVYWPSQKFWCVTMEKNVEKV